MSHKYRKIIALFIMLSASLATVSVLADNNYKVRLVKPDKNGGLIKIKTAANRSSAESAALADSDHGSDTGAVDVEFIDPNEASYRGQATEVTLSAAKADLDKFTAEVADTTNSSTSNLTNGSTFTGGFVSLAGKEAVNITVRTNQASATNGLVISWSDDGTNAIITQSYTVTTAGFAEVLPRHAAYYKVAYTNGGTTTTTLAITTTQLGRYPLTPTQNNPIITRSSYAPNIVINQASTNGTAAQIVAARATRRTLKLKNNDATNAVYVNTTSGVTTSTGYYLAAGQEMTMSTTSAIYGITASSTVLVSYAEEYD